MNVEEILSALRELDTTWTDRALPSAMRERAKADMTRVLNLLEDMGYFPAVIRGD